MLNKEKFAKEIIEIVTSGNFNDLDNDIAVVNGKPCPCGTVTCKDCDFINIRTCNKERNEWANSEYKELEIDWDKVPVDTPVLVWENGDKVRRYFKNFGTDDQGPFYYVFDYGATSWSRKSCSPWRNCELARKEDIQKYRKR